VGKSTLFNALTGAAASAENYPFCTVDPNVGVVEVPDRRLDLLVQKIRPKSRVPAVVTFVDIAGLVKGASEGEGLGNQFLSNIREVDAIVNVVRCFEDDDVTHVMGSVDPVRDREIINLELVLSDLQVVERRLERVARNAKTGTDKEAVAELALLERLQPLLSAGQPARKVCATNDDEARLLRSYNLLTSKQELYAANVAESDLAAGGNPLVDKLRSAIEVDGEPAEVVVLSARIEAELMHLAEAERSEFLEHLGIAEAGLDRLIRAGYHLLDLISFFTAGEKEVRAWTIHHGTRAPQAAGEIHSDFERGFIRAETLAWKDFEELGSQKAARDKGLVRSEGKEYVVQDGDILLFRFNV
ncbi:MAG TPA: redox-regulated ATPase YchF, partial [Longimicrobiales bacterium]